MKACTSTHARFGSCCFGAGHEVNYHAANFTNFETRIAANGARYRYGEAKFRYWDRNGNEIPSSTSERKVY